MLYAIGYTSKLGNENQIYVVANSLKEAYDKLDQSEVGKDFEEKNFIGINHYTETFPIEDHHISNKPTLICYQYLNDNPVDGTIGDVLEKLCIADSQEQIINKFSNLTLIGVNRRDNGKEIIII